MIFAATPSLRDTSPQGEAFRLPFRGAVGNADCGVASRDIVVPFSTALISIICDYHTTTPSLRDTSPQGEAFRLPFRGAVGNADCGVASRDIVVPFSTALISIICDYHTTTPSLRDTSPQGEAFRLPFRGAVGNADCGVASRNIVVPFSTALISKKRATNGRPYIQYCLT